MFSRTLFTSSLLTGILPLASHAQTAPRFYVGVGVNLLTNVPFVSGGTAPRLYGPALTAGLQLTPHLALQTGVAYFWRNDNRSQGYFDYSLPGPVVDEIDYHDKYFTIPVLLRYTFTPSAERFHVDALAGLTLAHHSYRNRFTRTYPSPSDSYSVVSDSSITRASVTLGPAVRYTLTPNVELTANALVSATLGDAYYYRFSDRLFLNVLVGVQYSFGKR